MKTEDRKVLDDRELNQARSKPDTVDQPVRTAHIFVHHYNSTQYCNTETVFSIFPFLQTNITSQMWPSGAKGLPDILYRMCLKNVIRRKLQFLRNGLVFQYKFFRDNL